MKTHFKRLSSRGFTLIELMVAMAITTIIVSVLVSITSVALGTWNRSRSELRAARQAKATFDFIVRDFEALVTRTGGDAEWLSALTPSSLPGSSSLQSSNAAELIFFTVAGDRYNGQNGATTTDKPGDISCVGYALQYQDPIVGSSGTFKTFALNRLLVDPDKTYTDFLGKNDLSAAYSTYKTKLGNPENFVAENIYQFTMTFYVQVTKLVGTTLQPITVPVKIGTTETSQSTTEFRITGAGLKTKFGGTTDVTSDEIKAGRVTAMEISMTVLSDLGVDQLRNRKFSGTQQAEFLTKNSYQFSKLVQLPAP